MAKKTDKKKHRKHRHIGMAIIASVVLIFCAVLMYDSVRLKGRLTEDQATVEELQQEISDQLEMQAALEAEHEYVNSEEYYKEQAREKLGLADSNDIIFKKQTD